MAERQYAACTFRDGDLRKYSFHWDGDEPLIPGDLVRVEDRRGGGWKKVRVVEVGWQMPNFETKPVLGLWEDRSELEDADDRDFLAGL